jgi:Na+/melibiose symporter-like transporter
MAQPQLKSRDFFQYGLLEAGVSAVESFLRLYLLIFYTDYVGIDPKLAGVIVGLGILWDALMDPLIGRWSDGTKSRFGRRIPWMFLGAPLFGISVVLCFSIYPSWSMEFKFFWLIVSNILINTSIAIVSIPHLALAGDMTKDSNTRTSLYAWRMGMSVLGLFLGVMVPGIVRSMAADSPSKDLYVAVVLAILALILSWLTCLGCWLALKRTSVQLMTETAQSLTKNKLLLKKFFRSKPFILLMIGYCIATLGQGLNSSLALYYYQHRLKMVESQFQVILAVFMLILVLSLPMWVLLSKRFSKNVLLSIGIGGLGVVSSLTYPFLPAGVVVWPVLVGAFGGVVLGAIALFEAHLSDLMSKSNLSESDYGFVFGLWKFLAKAARAIAITLSGLSLSWIGYSVEETSNADVLQKLGILFGPGVGGFFVVGACILYFSKLSNVSSPKN